MRPPVEIHDSSLRDSIGDFVTFHMKADELAEVLGIMDRAGYSSTDAFGGSAFLPTMRVLGEDPWQRLRIIRKSVTRTPLQAVLRGRMLFGRWPAPENTIKATLAHLRSLGVDRIKVAEPGLDLKGAASVVRMAKDFGFNVSASVALSWGEAPRAKDLLVEATAIHEAAGADSLTLQDPFGLLTPMQAAEVVRRYRAKSRLPLRLHFHDVNLLAVASLQAGLEAGAIGADTTISTLSWTYSPPQAESLVMALRGTPYDSGVNLAVLEEAAHWFEAAKNRKGFKYKAVYGVDHGALRGEMPSAVRRILTDALRETGRMDLLDVAWAETPKVWEALGRPPLFSPLVQAVCAQALENVLSGAPFQRLDYRVVSYLKGDFGSPRPGTRADLRRQAEIAPAVHKSLPLDVGELAPDSYPSEDDRLTYAYFPELAGEFFESRESGIGQAAAAPYFAAATSEPASRPNVPRSLMVKRQGEAYEVVLEGMGPLEGGKRMLFLRIGGETAKVEVTFPEDGAPPEYTILHHGRRHRVEFVEILNPGRKSMPVILREDDHMEEILFSFPKRA